jgi:hypothetical protein
MFEPDGAHFIFADRMGERIRANEAHWFKLAPSGNPRMLGVFDVRKSGQPKAPLA